MRITFLLPAESELDDAWAWYENQLPGLGRRFLDEVRQGRAQILAFPNAWHPLEGGIRRYRLKRFPYGLIYSVESNEIVVIAVAHLHREPDYWRDRLK